MVLKSWAQGEDGNLRAEVGIPNYSAWFDGHFPGEPILPGIAQLGLVYEVVRRAFHDPVRVAEVSNVRFKQLIGPDESLFVIADSRPQKGRYSFRILRDEEVVCTGSLTCALLHA